MYEDNLYLSNLYDYLEQPVTVVQVPRGAGAGSRRGVEFTNVSFTYPGAESAAIRDLTLTDSTGAERRARRR